MVHPLGYLNRSFTCTARLLTAYLSWVAAVKESAFNRSEAQNGLDALLQMLYSIQKDFGKD